MIITGIADIVLTGTIAAVAMIDIMIILAAIAVGTIPTIVTIDIINTS